MKERQEIFCHNCEKWVQFDIDTSLDGNHVLECPNCGHEHCRVVKNGVITGDRWDSRNGPTFKVLSSTVTTTTVSSYSSYIANTTDSTNKFASYALWDSWITSTT